MRNGFSSFRYEFGIPTSRSWLAHFLDHLAGVPRFLLSHGSGRVAGVWNGEHADVYFESALVFLFSGARGRFMEQVLRKYLWDFQTRTYFF